MADVQAGWGEFGVMVGSASGALTGLIFVASNSTATGS